MMFQTKIFRGGGEFDRYLKPEVELLDIKLEYGFALSASTAVSDEDDDYQIPGLGGNPDDDGTGEWDF